jgi:hypothetical protein
LQAFFMPEPLLEDFFMRLDFPPPTIFTEPAIVFLLVFRAKENGPEPVSPRPFDVLLKEDRAVFSIAVVL